MKLHSFIVAKEFLIKDEPDNQVFIVGTSVGNQSDGGSFFIVPIHISGEEVNQNAWGIEATTRGFPKIRANADKSEGMIAKLTSYGGSGKTVGKIFVVGQEEITRDKLELIAYGIGAEHGARWEEVIVKCSANSMFYVQRTNGVDVVILVTPEEVSIAPAQLFEVDDELIRVTDQSLPRWKPDAREKESSQ